MACVKAWERAVAIVALATSEGDAGHPRVGLNRLWGHRLPEAPCLLCLGPHVVSARPRETMSESYALHDKVITTLSC